MSIQKEFLRLGVREKSITLNTGLMTPFLDDEVPQEAALKVFLGHVCKLQIYSIPNQEVLEELMRRAEERIYTVHSPVYQQEYSLYLYSWKNKQTSVIANLLMFLVEPTGVFYCIDIKGNLTPQSFQSLKGVSPIFLEQYIARFQIQF
ncbi:MAG: hypothetical protein ACRCZB_03265 [Bacteroidales bacterium]